MTAATATQAAPTAASKNLDHVLDAMRSIQTESDRWKLGEALVKLIPSGSSGFDVIIDTATKEGLGGGLSANTLRLYRDSAIRWPADKRVPNVSFSAHREAMVLPSITEAARLLAGLAKQLGADKVTVASVRKAIAVQQGKPIPGSGKAAAASTAKQVDFLKDLMSGAPQLIAAIPTSATPDELDKLHAGLTKAISHVERLRAKAARKQQTPAKAAAAAPAAASAPAKKASAKKARGDLRGL